MSQLVKCMPCKHKDLISRQKLFEGGMRRMCAAGPGGVVLWKSGGEECG